MKKSGKERREENLINIKRLTKLFSSLFFFSLKGCIVLELTAERKQKNRGQKRTPFERNKKKLSFFSLERQAQVREHADAEQPSDHRRLRGQGSRVAALGLSRLGVVQGEALLGGVALFVLLCFILFFGGSRERE
jgi:hypothetical protein